MFSLKQWNVSVWFSWVTVESEVLNLRESFLKERDVV